MLKEETCSDPLKRLELLLPCDDLVLLRSEAWSKKKIEKKLLPVLKRGLEEKADILWIQEGKEESTFILGIRRTSTDFGTSGKKIVIPTKSFW